MRYVGKYFNMDVYEVEGLKKGQIIILNGTPMPEDNSDKRGTNEQEENTEGNRT